MRSKYIRIERYPREPKTLGEHIRKRRLDLRLHQSEASQKLGVPFGTVQGWENNRGEPAVEFLPKIIEFLGYNPLPEAKTIGERLRRLRRTHGLPIRPVALYLGVDSGAMSRWERGDRIAYPHILQLFEAFLERFENASEGELREAMKGGPSGKQSNFDHPLNPLRIDSLGKLLVKRRLELGLSQTEAGRLMNVGRGAILNWEMDTGTPDHRFMPSVIRFLGSLPWPESNGRRLAIFRKALGMECLAFERRYKVWRQHLFKVERGQAEPPPQIMKIVEATVAETFPESKFPRVTIFDVAGEVYRPCHRREPVL